MTQLIVWYDGGCPLCRKEIRWIRRLDRRGSIEFVDAADVAALTGPIGRTELLAWFHVSEDGQILSGAAAFAAMWRAIPVLRPLGLAARVPWVLRILEYGYARFLRIRPRVQGLFKASRA